MNFVSKAQVIQIFNHSPIIREYILELEKERKYSPGSFVQLTLDLVTASDIWPGSRTFSIASYQKGIMRFVIKKVGYYTDKIFNELNIGNYCTVKYPFGELFKQNTEDEKHVFIAGGVGVTPFLGLLEYFKAINKLENVSMLYSVKHEADLLHIDSTKKRLDNRLKVFITQEITEIYTNRRIIVDDINQVAYQDSNIYVCGSKTFNADFISRLNEHGYQKIHVDEWE
jgi:ferredoxin-NADP reductase